MYAILNDGKFIRARFFLDSNEVFDFSVSNEPKYYKTRAEAERVMNLVLEKIGRSMKFYTDQIAEDAAKTARAQSRIDQLTEKLEDLYTQPYKEVERQVAQVRKQIESAKWQVESSSVKSRSRELTRLNRINRAGLSVVKVQQTVILA